MNRSLDEVIERVKVREVAGIFHSYDALDVAADDLLQAGFDRAQIAIIGDLRSVEQRLGHADVVAEDLADLPLTPRRPYLAREDIAMAASVVAGVVAAAGGLAVSYGIVASGNGPGLAILAAAVAALTAGGVAAGIVGRRLKRRTPAMERLTRERGIVVWVRVRSGEQERTAQELLRGHGARAVHVHEIEIDKRAEDLPLASLRPDPWLGNERLGEP